MKLKDRAAEVIERVAVQLIVVPRTDSGGRLSQPAFPGEQQTNSREAVQTDLPRRLACLRWNSEMQSPR